MGLCNTNFLGAEICSVDPNCSTLQCCAWALNEIAVCGNFWQELPSWAFLWNVTGGVAFALTQETGLPASASNRVCPLKEGKLPLVNYQVGEIGVKISIAKCIGEAPRSWAILTCHVVHAISLLNNNQKTPVNAVKHDSKIMSCPVLPSLKANKSLKIKMFPLIFKSLHELHL